MSDSAQSIAIALSGGGIRAMAFHLGVLHWLAEKQSLERVAKISSVSGGSLVVGLIFQQHRMKWPSSQSFVKEIYPALRKRLCSQSLVQGAALRLLLPQNWRYAFSRTNVLALTLRQAWGVTASLSDLPASPEWAINATNAENGRRFRFKRADLGDYLTGYASSDGYPLANAIAVSAAFPGGLGPLRLETRNLAWKRRDHWDAPVNAAKTVVPPFRVLHLYDGGVYDNLGLEPFFDAGRGVAKIKDAYIFVSDAGKPLASGFSSGALNPFRLKRVADIMSDQSHALRVRTFQHFIQQNSARGSFVHIQNACATGPSDDHQLASQFPTSLRQLSEAEFDAIARHGYGLARDSSQVPRLSSG